MKIALFHNLGAGGAKRHLYEQTRELTARGHIVDLFLTADSADPQEFLPLAPLCREVKTYSEGSAEAQATTTPAPPPAATGRSWKRKIIELVPELSALSEWRQVRPWQATLDRLSACHKRIAQDIDAGGYDAAYIAQCRWMLAPDILRFLHRTPSLFCCHDTLRSVMEWPVDPAPEYDSLRLTAWTNKHRYMGRMYTLGGAKQKLAEQEARRFEWNTRSADRVLANSFYSRERLLALTGVDARVCYPGVDSDFFCPDPLQPREGQLVVSIGALLPGKRHDFVIRAIATLPESCRPRLLIVGYGDRFGEARLGEVGERLVKQAADLRVEMTVQPEVTDEAIRAAYRRAGVVAFAPYLEPFGLVSLEASACEAPVVGVAEGGVRETVRDGETGYLTDHDPILFGAALQRVLSDTQLAEQMGRRGRERTVSDWTWGRCVDVLEEQLSRTADTEKRERAVV